MKTTEEIQKSKPEKKSWGRKRLVRRVFRKQDKVGHVIPGAHLSPSGQVWLGCKDHDLWGASYFDPIVEDSWWLMHPCVSNQMIALFYF